MKERLLVVLAFLAFLVPGGLAWLAFLTDPPPMPEDMRAAAARFVQATEYEQDGATLCSEVDKLRPWLERGAAGSLGERARAPFAQARELAESVGKDCRGGAPREQIEARVHRLGNGLPAFARPRWFEGRAGVARVSVLVLVPIEALVVLAVWLVRRRERRRLEAVVGAL